MLKRCFISKITNEKIIKNNLLLLNVKMYYMGQKLILFFKILFISDVAIIYTV